ncbi:polyketide cyclase/dehydrase and lipid transporter [Peziza echinospora]|nr:polyketide cyclase/dehydrase and lipid transporter [Peziza echinospora]
MRPPNPTPLLRALTRTPTPPTTTTTTTTPLLKKRTFFPSLPSLPGSPSSTTSTQTISATRHLPYPRSALYTLISDIDSYTHFLPYCLSSTVLTRDPATSLPTSADLRIGFAAFDETFRSKVTCVAPVSVEADASGSALFEKLKTRWEVVEEGAGEATSSTVSLHIEFGFTNPLYAALSQAVVPKLAGTMIDAFEKRAEDVLGRKGRLERK